MAPGLDLAGPSAVGSLDVQEVDIAGVFQAAGKKLNAAVDCVTGTGFMIYPCALRHYRRHDHRMFKHSLRVQ